jgi:hypothetical protein
MLKTEASLQPAARAHTDPHDQANVVLLFTDAFASHATNALARYMSAPPPLPGAPSNKRKKMVENDEELEELEDESEEEEDSSEGVRGTV